MMADKGPLQSLVSFLLGAAMAVACIVFYISVNPKEDRWFQISSWSDGAEIESYKVIDEKQLAHTKEVKPVCCFAFSKCFLLNGQYFFNIISIQFTVNGRFFILIMYFLKTSKYQSDEKVSEFNLLMQICYRGVSSST